VGFAGGLIDVPASVTLAEEKLGRGGSYRLRKVDRGPKLPGSLIDGALSGASRCLVALDVDAIVFDVRRLQAKEIPTSHACHEFQPHVGLDSQHAALLAAMRRGDESGAGWESQKPLRSLASSSSVERPAAEPSSFSERQR